MEVEFSHCKGIDMCYQSISHKVCQYRTRLSISVTWKAHYAYTCYTVRWTSLGPLLKYSFCNFSRSSGLFKSQLFTLIGIGLLNINIKGQLHSKNKLSSNERARKMQKNEPSLTSMRQMVLEISHSKFRNLSKMEVAILKVFSLILTQI